MAKRRVQRSVHPGVSQPEPIDEAAAWVEPRPPEWAMTEAVDDTVDEVLGYAEMLVAGVGPAPAERVTRRGPIRHLVSDTEAASALSSQQPLRAKLAGSRRGPKRPSRS